MTNFLSYARGPQFMGRKLVRENKLLRSGGLLSFPRTGCALRASVILSREKRSWHYGRTSPPRLSEMPFRCFAGTKHNPILSAILEGDRRLHAELMCCRDFPPALRQMVRDARFACQPEPLP